MKSSVPIFFIILSSFVALKAPFVYSSDTLLNGDKVKALCEKEPTSKRCKKYLDSKYRRHTDAERSNVPDIYETMPGDKEYKNQLRNELRSFCRKEPDAPRCQKMKKK